jgi:hypothetical protein
MHPFFVSCGNRVCGWQARNNVGKLEQQVYAETTCAANMKCVIMQDCQKDRSGGKPMWSYSQSPCTSYLFLHIGKTEINKL